MYSLIGGSLIFKLFKIINAWYIGSLLNRIVSVVDSNYKLSRTHNILVRFFSKNPTFGYSRTYRIISFLAGKINAQMAKLHNTLMPNIKSSITKSLFSNLKKEIKNDFSFPVNAFLIPFTVGYALLITVKNTWGMQSLIITSILVFIAFIIALSGKNWVKWFNASSLKKFLQYIWE